MTDVWIATLLGQIDLAFDARAGHGPTLLASVRGMDEAAAG